MFELFRFPALINRPKRVYAVMLICWLQMSFFCFTCIWVFCAEIR